jgi:hypothetical protein
MLRAENAVSMNYTGCHLRDGLLLSNPEVQEFLAAKFCTVAPNNFSMILSFLFLDTNICITSHASSRKCEITMRFTGHSRIMGPQYETTFGYIF